MKERVKSFSDWNRPSTHLLICMSDATFKFRFLKQSNFDTMCADNRWSASKIAITSRVDTQAHVTSES